MLLLWDRGFHSFEMVRAVLGSGRPGQRRPPSRAPATLKARLVRTLADGTKLVLIRRRRPPSEEERLRGERTLVMVRLVRYTLEDQIPSWPSAGASPDQLAARLRKRPRTGSGPRLPRSLGVRARRGRDENPPAPAPKAATTLREARGRHFRRSMGFWWPIRWFGPSWQTPRKRRIWRRAG